MIQDLGWTRGQIMLGHTASAMLFGLASPITAALINRIGAKNTFSAGTIIVIFTNTMLAFFAQSYPMYLFLSFLNGLGMCLSSVLATQTIAIAWFKMRRAFLNLVFIRNTPQEMGQHPDGIDPDIEIPLSSSARKPIYRTTVNWSLKDAIRSKAFWLIVIASSGNIFLWEIILSQAPFHLQDRGFDPTMAAFFYSLAIGASIIGRFGIAAIGDYFETRLLFAAGIASILTGGILFWFASPNMMFVTYLYPILAGIGFGTAFVCRSLFVSNYFGAASFATISGIIAPMQSIITASAPPFGGYMFDLQGSYFIPMLVAWIAGGIGIVASLLSTPPKPLNEPIQTAQL
jgi:MFS family permease